MHIKDTRGSTNKNISGIIKVQTIELMKCMGSGGKDLNPDGPTNDRRKQPEPSALEVEGCPTQIHPVK